MLPHLFPNLVFERFRPFQHGSSLTIIDLCWLFNHVLQPCSWRFLLHFFSYQFEGIFFRHHAVRTISRIQLSVALICAAWNQRCTNIYIVCHDQCPRFIALKFAALSLPVHYNPWPSAAQCVRPKFMARFLPRYSVGSKSMFAKFFVVMDHFL